MGYDQVGLSFGKGLLGLLREERRKEEEEEEEEGEEDFRYGFVWIAMVLYAY